MQANTNSDTEFQKTIPHLLNLKLREYARNVMHTTTSQTRPTLQAIMEHMQTNYQKDTGKYSIAIPNGDHILLIEPTELELANLPQSAEAMSPKPNKITSVTRVEGENSGFTIEGESNSQQQRSYFLTDSGLLQDLEGQKAQGHVAEQVHTNFYPILKQFDMTRVDIASDIEGAAYIWLKHEQARGTKLHLSEEVKAKWLQQLTTVKEARSLTSDFTSMTNIELAMQALKYQLILGPLTEDDIYLDLSVVGRQFFSPGDWTGCTLPALTPNSGSEHSLGDRPDNVNKNTRDMFIERVVANSLKKHATKMTSAVSNRTINDLRLLSECNNEFRQKLLAAMIEKIGKTDLSAVNNTGALHEHYKMIVKDLCDDGTRRFYIDIDPAKRPLKKADLFEYLGLFKDRQDEDVIFKIEDVTNRSSHLKEMLTAKMTGLIVPDNADELNAQQSQWMFTNTMGKARAWQARRSEIVLHNDDSTPSGSDESRNGQDPMNDQLLFQNLKSDLEQGGSLCTIIQHSRMLSVDRNEKILLSHGSFSPHTIILAKKLQDELKRFNESEEGLTETAKSYLEKAVAVHLDEDAELEDFADFFDYYYQLALCYLYDNSKDAGNKREKIAPIFSNLMNLLTNPVDEDAWNYGSPVTMGWSKTKESIAKCKASEDGSETKMAFDQFDRIITDAGIVQCLGHFPEPCGLVTNEAFVGDMSKNGGGVLSKKGSTVTTWFGESADDSAPVIKRTQNVPAISGKDYVLTRKFSVDKLLKAFPALRDDKSDSSVTVCNNAVILKAEYGPKISALSTKEKLSPPQEDILPEGLTLGRYDDEAKQFVFLGNWPMSDRIELRISASGDGLEALYIIANDPFNADLKHQFINFIHDERLSIIQKKEDERLSIIQKKENELASLRADIQEKEIKWSKPFVSYATADPSKPLFSSYADADNEPAKEIARMGIILKKMETELAGEKAAHAAALAGVQSDLASEKAAHAGVQLELASVRSAHATELTTVRSELEHEKAAHAGVQLELKTLQAKYEAELAIKRGIHAFELAGGVQSELASVRSAHATELTTVRSELEHEKAAHAGVQLELERVRLLAGEQSELASVRSPHADELAGVRSELASVQSELERVRLELTGARSELVAQLMIAVEENQVSEKDGHGTEQRDVRLERASLKDDHAKELAGVQSELASVQSELERVQSELKRSKAAHTAARSAHAPELAYEHAGIKASLALEKVKHLNLIKKMLTFIQQAMTEYKNTAWSMNDGKLYETVTSVINALKIDHEEGWPEPIRIKVDSKPSMFQSIFTSGHKATNKIMKMTNELTVLQTEIRELKQACMQRQDAAASSAGEAHGAGATTDLIAPSRVKLGAMSGEPNPGDESEVSANQMSTSRL